MTCTHKNLKIHEKLIGTFVADFAYVITHHLFVESCTEIRELDKTVLCCICTIALSKMRGFGKEHKN